MSETTERIESISEKVYRLFEAGNIGTVVSLDDLALAGCNVRKSRSSLYRALRWLLERRGLAAVAVIGIGYQIVHPNEAPKLIRGRVRKAGKQIREGRRVGDHIDRKIMDQDQRQQTDQWMVCVRGLEQELRDVQRRQEFHSRILARHEEDIATLKQINGIPLTGEQMEALREMVREEVRNTG